MRGSSHRWRFLSGFAGKVTRVLVSLTLASGVLVPAQALADGALEAASLSLAPQAAGSISVTSKISYDLYTGDPGTTHDVTVKNTGSVTVSNVRIVRLTENAAATTKGAEKTVGYRWNDSGDSSNSLGWLWLEKDYPCDATDIVLAPGESVTFPVKARLDYRLDADEWFPAGTTVVDTFEARADGAVSKKVTSTVRVSNPASAPLSIGRFQDEGWNLTKFGTVNLGSIAAGTQYNDGNGYAFGIKNESSAATNNPIYRITSTKLVKESESDPDIFSLWGPGRPYIVGNADALSTAAFNIEADAAFAPAGTYKATLVIGISPGSVVVNGGRYSTIKVDSNACTVSVPVKVKVTGANPNLPAKVTGLSAEAGDGFVHLTWDKVGGSNEGYCIFRSDLGFEEPIGTIYGAGQTYYTDTSVENGTVYTYYVTAGSEAFARWVEKSDPASATPRAGVAGRLLAPVLNDVDYEDHAVRLEWTLNDLRDRGDGLERVSEAWGDGMSEEFSFGTNTYVSHFVIYMDGKAVAHVAQSAVAEWGCEWAEVTMSDGTQGSAYLSHYGWSCSVPVDVPQITHRFSVAAVDAETGLEGYRSNELDGFADGADPDPSTWDFIPSYTMLSDGVEFSFIDSYDWHDPATYSVYRSKDGGAETVMKSGLASSIEGMTYADRPSANGSYTYRLKRNDAGEVTWSYPVTFVKKDYALVEPPGAPALVTDAAAERFSRGGSHKVQLVWSPADAGGPVDHFVIYRAYRDSADIADLNSGYAADIDVLAEVPVGTTSYLDTNVWPQEDDGTVCYLVRAVNETGESANAAWTKVECIDGVDWADAPPGKPTITKLEWSEGESASLHVEWAAGSGGDVSSWQVKLHVPGADGYAKVTTFEDMLTNSCTFDEWDLNDDMARSPRDGFYSVVVVARNSKGDTESAPATYTRGVVDSKPQAPQVEIPAKSMSGADAYQPSIKLAISPSWQDPWAGSVASFNVWRSRSQDGNFELVGSAERDAGSESTAYFDTSFPPDGYAIAMNNLAPGLYWYKVSAVNERGESERSDAISWYAFKSSAIGEAIAAVEDAVAQLPETDGLNGDNYANHKQGIAAANAAFERLPEGQQAAVSAECRSKLAALVAKAAVLEKVAADKAAAEAVAGMIAALPDDPADLTLDDRAAVAAARAACDALTDEQLAYIADGVLVKLVAAEERIAALQKVVDDKAAADDVRVAIEALPAREALTLADAHAVASARLAHDALTDDQKVHFASGAYAAALERLEGLEGRVAELRQPFDVVVAVLGALPARASVTLAARGAIADARAAYDALPDGSRALVPAALVTRLTDAEGRLPEVADLGNATVADVFDKAYTGAAVTQSPTVRDAAGVKLVFGIDYLLDYSPNTNVGTVAMTVVGQGAYAGTSTTRTFAITPRPLALTVSLSSSEFTYTGAPQRPSVTVKAAGRVLAASDYTITWPAGCTAVGLYRVKVALRGNYAGSGGATFTIVPKGTSISKLKAAKRGFTAKWKRQALEVGGYKLQYSLKKNFSRAKTVTVKKAKATSKKIGKLKSKKRYYVRICTFKKAAGVTYCSPWSKPKSVKVR